MIDQSVVGGTVVVLLIGLNTAVAEILISMNREESHH